MVRSDFQALSFTGEHSRATDEMTEKNPNCSESLVSGNCSSLGANGIYSQNNLFVRSEMETEARTQSGEEWSGRVTQEPEEPQPSHTDIHCL